MNKDQKAAVIEDVAGELSSAQAVFAVDYRGLSVPQSAELRARLRDSDARFAVVKNTLSERAADQVGADALKPFLAGPTAMTFVRGDAAAAAKTLNDFRRANGGLPAFKGGWMNGSSLSPEQIESIARLPSREALYGQLVGMVASPLTGLASALNGLISGIARQLQAIADQGLVPAAGGGVAATAPVAETPGDDRDESAGDTEPATGGEDPDAGPASTPDSGPHPDPDPATEPSDA